MTVVGVAMVKKRCPEKKEREDATYTPMTDCFFGASPLMMTMGDLLIKD
jgi:hypothetical protein